MGLCAALAAAGFYGSAVGQESHVGTLRGHAEKGADSYKRFCAGCHGTRGDGKGTFAPYLDPKPRDFTTAMFKSRSTPSGTLPTDQDLYDTLMRGIVTSAMPSWAPLAPQERVNMVAYVKKFSPRFAQETAGTPIAIPAETPISLQTLRHGAEVYARMDCARCHGQEGRGNGPDAATLVDFKHLPDLPYDYTLTSRFKTGSTNEALYQMLMTGMDGTPMASYADKMTPAEAWDVVHFIRTQQEGLKSPERETLNANGGVGALAVAPVSGKSGGKP
jgi:cytochrome c oxidase cbb3-type subunit 2